MVSPSFSPISMIQRIPTKININSLIIDSRLKFQQNVQLPKNSNNKYKLMRNKASDLVKIESIKLRLNFLNNLITFNEASLINCLYVSDNSKGNNNYEELGYRLINIHLNIIKKVSSLDQKKMLLKFLDSRKLNNISNLPLPDNRIPLRIKRIHDLKTLYKIIGYLSLQNDTTIMAKFVRTEILSKIYRLY
ncbi:hypothetical protein TPHA_0B02180 [Tetrapisispora phaffii CBS 4417]|uniref:RNase III domain-containing protein n=1 Tax=Tetrapisispora phaffii (strain ATCC 24235 / CBS 4417 / NBRC 1672 / NRRL Y-8282 / UCD 70-5) TaxID=1071381 RepID=G8BPF9_TETPH|nr:hypothetical protein TPHA_0B02180 [Tetrapisispora phaffii CBS 4417]CCE61890.1 hypothetical protein TPHA_0B02180 [Tetrapisispora phaffii CBS 4417]